MRTGQPCLLKLVADALPVLHHVFFSFVLMHNCLRLGLDVSTQRKTLKRHDIVLDETVEYFKRECQPNFLNPTVFEDFLGLLRVAAVSSNETGLHRFVGCYDPSDTLLECLAVVCIQLISQSFYEPDVGLVVQAAKAGWNLCEA